MTGSVLPLSILTTFLWMLRKEPSSNLFSSEVSCFIGPSSSSPSVRRDSLHRSVAIQGYKYLGQFCSTSLLGDGVKGAVPC